MKIKTSSIRSFIYLAVWLSIGISTFSFWVSGQTLVLPSRTQFAQGKGECEDLAVGAVSDSWRVRKKDKFSVSAVQNLTRDSNLNYSWSVTNGKILSGQGTSRIEVQAGDQKTQGYVNANGFVTVRLAAERIRNGGRCAVEASTTVMVGRFGEVYANVYDIIIDETSLIRHCPPGMRSTGAPSPSDDMVVDIATVAADPENDPVSYKYFVSGGKIVDSGANVKWDLSGAAPGTYTITAGVDDGCGLCGNTITRIVTIKDSSCSVVFACPHLDLSSPTSPSENGLYNFNAYIESASYVPNEYLWTVTNTEVVEGLGTPSIKVKAPLNPSDPEPTITVRVVGALTKNGCLDTRTFTIPKAWYQPR